MTFVLRDTSGNDNACVVSSNNQNKFYLNNNALSDITLINMWFSNSNTFTFPFNGEAFDYYVIGSLVAPCINVEESTFKPTIVDVKYYDVTLEREAIYNSSDLNIFNVDTYFYKGFGFYEKVDFKSADSSSISSILLDHDINGTGKKPANLIFECGIMAIPVGTSESEINLRILNKLSEMQESITDSIGSAADQVTDAIENQYGMNPGESFGVQDLTSQVEDKLGVLSFGADTLNNFLGLFQASNAGSTVLTFPGFTIDVQGESYQVWNDMQFDLAFLEENFGVLIIAVRTVTVLCVWLAVLGYLVKAYEHLVNNKG